MYTLPHLLVSKNGLKILVGIFSLFLMYPLLGQNDLLILDDTFPAYPFINYESNQIEQGIYLSPFFEKLEKLEKGEIQQVRIAHIGDSHVQADLFPGMLRALFQRKFGSAGRGLVFFYKQAGTHSPLDYKTESDQSWESRRRIFQKNAPPIGISGMSIESASASFLIHFYQKDRYGLPQIFNKLTLFHNDAEYDYTINYSMENDLELRPPSSLSWRFYKIKPGDTLYSLSRRFKCSVSDIQIWNQLKSTKIMAGQQIQIKIPGPSPDAIPGLPLLNIESDQAFTSSLLINEPAQSFTLKGLRRKNTAKGAQLFGLVLENSEASGILYNMMGVNGATYYHFNHAEHFKEQLAYLKPDLIIITLGTNEAIQRRFYPDQVSREIEALVQTLQWQHEDAGILLMTNPDVLIKKSYPSPNTPKVAAFIRETAKKYKVALWDLNRLMGEEGVVRDWRAEELSHKDFIHFSQKGYTLQAHLLYKALMDSYNAANR